MNLDIRFFVSLIVFQAFTTAAVALNIDIIRQIFGFSYLIFIPGFILVRVLRIRGLDITETLVFSVGLSISFLMFVGLFVNELFPAIGLQYPLLSFRFLMIINVILAILSLFSFSDRGAAIGIMSSIFHIRNVVVVLFLVLTLTGSFFSVHYSNSGILLVTIALMAIIWTLASYKKILSIRSYPVVLFASALAIVFMTYFVTDFMGVWDHAFEYYTFRNTQISLHWNSGYLPSIGLQVWKTNSMLSVNILPTIISETAGLEGVLVFKILYAFILSLIPVVMYKLYTTQVAKEISFVAAAFFLANCVGLGWGNDMQKIAQLFYILLLFVIFKNGLSDVKRNLLFVVFALSLIVSHYSMAYIFAFTLLGTWVFFWYRKQTSSKISAGHVIFAFVGTFSWYVYVSKGATFEAILESARYVYDNLRYNFFNVEARGSQVTNFLGVSISGGNTIFHQMSRMVFQLSTVLIVLGFVGVLFKRSKIKLAREFYAMICLNLLIVLLNLVLPGLSATLLMQRFYQTTLILLSPLFVVGGYFIFDNLGLVWKKAQNEKFVYVLVVSVLVLLLLFQSGFVYELTRVDCWASSLSSYRIDKVVLYDGFGLSNAFDVSSATWIGAYRASQNQTIYCDDYSKDGALLSYGLIDNKFVIELTNTTYTFQSNSTIFLRWVNVVEGQVVSPPLIWNMTDVASVGARNVVSSLAAQDMIYCNGGSIIYKVP